ncbi:MATE efflux family LAL5-like [Olea europaea subsp. europaea]|uniref:MATE efflux family LAL5-like n=1 Tax=Olea europaea subsp. europaea TaxID=158383 RepID=A0A8S0QM12_OLEEU|nr:MATE efflux family LAL5-like [Olea europaea subsp. europaea]
METLKWAPPEAPSCKIGAAQYALSLPSLLLTSIAYALVHWTTLDYKGVSLAASISLWISILMLSLYVLKAKKFEETWNALRSESLSHIFSNLKIALPLAAMAGLMPNSEVTTSLIAMCVNTEAVAYMFAYGLSAAASTRVSNELGVGNPD